MKGGAAQRARRRSAMAHRWSMRLASSRRSRRSSAGCRGRSSSSGTGGDAGARGGRGRVMGVSFSLPFMGREVAQQPGGEGRGWARRVACGVAPTRLRLGLSHPPHEGEGDWAHGFGRRAFRRAVGGLGGAPGRRPECDVYYRFDADRCSARTGFHELGAGAGLIGYPRRPRRAGACLRQASRNGPCNPRDPGRSLSDGRGERPVTRLRRLLVGCGLRSSGYLRPRKQPAPVGWQAGRRRRRSPASPPFASWTARRAPPDAPLGSRPRPAAATDAARSDKNPAPSAPAARKVAGLTSPPCDGTRAGWHGGKLGRAERRWRRGKGGKLLRLRRDGKAGLSFSPFGRRGAARGG